MKTKIILLCLSAIFFLSFNVSAQALQGGIKVSYSSQQKKAANAPSYYFNDVLMEQKMFFFDPGHIESINIKENSQFSEIYIRTKQAYKLTFLTPVQIKDKYAHLTAKSVLYFIDGTLVDENNTSVEEGFVLSINVVTTKYSNSEFGNRKLSLVQISTKSKENLAKSAEIRIRGFGK
ncbi:hypothetical protein [Pedobacter sp. JCM 36344]|uniref:hypothetical protein n=1 Tax=Pedobacter sp. JCM 36344 TaxID=3374280 RepID=UPI00397DDCA1